MLLDASDSYRAPPIGLAIASQDAYISGRPMMYILTIKIMMRVQGLHFKREQAGRIVRCGQCVD